jgi:hypothetical protein
LLVPVEQAIFPVFEPPENYPVARGKALLRLVAMYSMIWS